MQRDDHGRYGPGYHQYAAAGHPGQGYYPPPAAGQGYIPPRQEQAPPPRSSYNARDSVRVNGQHRLSGNSTGSRRKAEGRSKPRGGGKQRQSLGRRLKDHFVAMAGEFVGTVLFLWFAFAWHSAAAVQNPIKGPNGGASSTLVLYISLGYGFSLLVNAWCFYRISGGLFNPAVTFGLVLAGALPPIRGLCLFPAQILGGIAAAALISCMLPTPISVVNTSLSTVPPTSVVQGLFIEMFLTALLLFTIIMLAAEKSKATFLAPLAIGLALFVAELAGVLYTGGSLNPARTFGPAVVSGTWYSYHWIYWVGPLLGSLISTGLYYFVKLLNYEEANPGQDSAKGDFGGEP